MNINRANRLLTAAALTAVVVCGTSTTLRAGDAEQVETFLARLGLVELQILHLENQLQREMPAGERTHLAQHLADLYAGRLLATQDDADASADVLRRIDTLVKKVPEANTSSLAVMLLQAEYTRGERLVGQWMANPKLAEPRNEARKIFASIAPKLAGYHKDLTGKAERLSERLDEMNDGPTRDARERDWRQMQAVAGRAAYFSGWSHYYLGLLTSDKTALTAARTALRQLLDIGEEEKYTDIDAEWLGLASVYRSWAVIGLGVTEAALGNLEASRACFELLGSPNVPLEVRDQSSYWYLQGLINAGNFALAKQFAETQTEAFSGDATQGKVSFCVALVRAGFGHADASSDMRRLGELGLVTLVKLGQSAAARKLMDEYGVVVDEHAGFFLKWLKGRQLFSQAERTKQPEAYQVAAKQLAAALDDSQAKRHAGMVGQARYELAWCAYRQKDYPTAAREFEQAVPGLKLVRRNTAAESAWAAVHCYREAGKDLPQYINSAIRMLELIIREFPEHNYARQAPFLINKLKEKAVPTGELIARLNRIPPDDPTYAMARYEICSLMRRAWLEATGDKTAAARKLREAVDTYVPLAGDAGADSRKLKCLLMVAEIALATKPPDRDLAAAYLDQAQPLAEKLPPTSSAVQEYHYRRMQLAVAAGNDAGVREHAGWLAENAAGSTYEESALVNQARAIDQAAQTATGADLQRIDREGYAVYARLVALLGDNREAISAKKNARVASSRLAHYAYEIGDYVEAGQRLDRLLQAFPDNAAYLRRAMLAHFQAGNFAAALEHARTLLEGNRSSSDPWYEAKYYQLQCLWKTDPKTARPVWQQFKLLHPNMGGPDWRERFETLGRGIDR